MCRSTLGTRNSYYYLLLPFTTTIYYYYDSSSLRVFIRPCISVPSIFSHQSRSQYVVNMCTHEHKNMCLEVGMCLSEESSRSGSANSTWKILAVHDTIAPSGIFEHPTIFIAPKNSSTRTTSWTSHFKKVRTCDTNTWVPSVRMILQGYVVNSIVTIGRTRK